MSTRQVTMLQKITDYEPLLPHLEDDIENCLYIYMDLVNGEKECADMDVWVQGKKSRTELILLRYYENFQIYGKKCIDSVEVAAVVQIMEKYKPKMVSGSENVIRALEKTISGCHGDGVAVDICAEAVVGQHCITEKLGDLAEGGYRAEYGYVYEMCSRGRLRSAAGIVELAGEADVAEIAHLLGMDQGLSGHYLQEKLEQQIKNRIRMKTGRSYIIREKNRIVAHTATYAETEKYAIVSGTIVHPDCRDKGYYPIISSHIVQKLQEEGKRLFTFAVEPRMVEYHDRMDEKHGSYGRLMRS